jgi:hypothetical protein
LIVHKALLSRGAQASASNDAVQPLVLSPPSHGPIGNDADFIVGYRGYLVEVRDRTAEARSRQAEGGTRHSKKSRGLLREGIDVKFGFIAKHRGIWPADWLCEALGVSRGGFYAKLTRPRSQHSRHDEEHRAKVRASFVASDRTYGARRVWRDLLTEGIGYTRQRVMQEGIAVV